MRRTVNSLSLMAFRSVRRGTQALAVARVPTTAAVLPFTRTGSFSNFISTQQRFAHDAALADATRRELEEELSRSGKPEEPKPPAGWRVEHVPGNRNFRLSKNYEDETLLVYYYPKENMGDTNSHQIMVQVTRNGQALQADLSFEEGELVLENICYFPDAKLAEDESAEADMKRNQLYPGPKLSELDGALVDSFISYFDKRGVNEELGEFIILYSFWSEQQEYERWLSSINMFVS